MLPRLRCAASRLAFTVIALNIGVSHAADATPGAAVTDPHFQFAAGYMPQDKLPDSLKLLGAPPSADSAALARDEEARRQALSRRGSAREQLARLDADLLFPQPAENFSCAMGMDITATQTPHLYRLMQRVLTDAGLSTYGVKNTYNRVRPFVVHSEGTCLPEQEAVLRTDGSYPSGHTAAGWAWALVLAEIHPERADTLLQRGLAFGQSRVICDAHWQSDVDAGRTMGAATVAALHNYPEFLADLAAARQEVQTAQTMPPASLLRCTAEAAALAAP